MRTSLRAVIGLSISIAAVCLAVAAFASTPETLDTPVSSRPMDPGSTDPGRVPEPTPQVVEPRPGMVAVTPISLDTATIGDDDVTLTITFWAGVEPCSVLDHVDVREGAAVVTVTLYQGSDPSAGDVACPEIAMLKQVSVILDHPLADRGIVDGAAS